MKLKILLLLGVILLPACNDDLKVLTWEHPEVNESEDKVIFVVGNMGENPIESLRICMQYKHQYSHHGIPRKLINPSPKGQSIKLLVLGNGEYFSRYHPVLL